MLFRSRPVTLSDSVELESQFCNDTPSDAVSRDAVSPGLPPVRELAKTIKPVHGACFRWVRWTDGTEYTFSLTQSHIVAMLWHAREEGIDWVLGSTLLEGAESSAERLRDLFRGHPAWRVLIVPAHMAGGPQGAYRLAP